MYFPLVFGTIKRPPNPIAPVASSKQECDGRTSEYKNRANPTAYDPRCRPWYQDAVVVGNTGVIFTKPYEDVGSGLLMVTVAAPVFDAVDTTLLLGVVGMDVDFTDIEQSINDLKVVDDEGYAFLLAPGAEEVAVHKDLPKRGEPVRLTDLESEVDPEEMNLIVAAMKRDCSGTATYSKNEATWILAWNRETVSAPGVTDGSGICGYRGFVAVVTVSKDALLEVSTTYLCQTRIEFDMIPMNIERQNRVRYDTDEYWTINRVRYDAAEHRTINRVRHDTGEFRTIIEFDVIPMNIEQ